MLIRHLFVRVLFSYTLTAVLSGQTVDAVISFSVATNETAKSIGTEAASAATFSVDIGNVDLDRGVVLGSDEAVGGRAKMPV